MLAALGATEAEWVFTCPPPSPRAMPAHELAEAALELGVDPARVEAAGHGGGGGGPGAGRHAARRPGGRGRFAVPRGDGPGRPETFEMLPAMTTADRTLVICKPDAVERRLVGEIVSRLERKGLRIAEMRMETISKETAGQHYGEHQGKPFYDDLVAFITRGPAVLMVVEGPEAFSVVRTLMGTTNPRQAAPGTIRGDLAIELTENLVHGSDSNESAAREIALFFGS